MERLLVSSYLDHQDNSNNSSSNNDIDDDNYLVDVTPQVLLVATLPLLVIAGISYRYQLHVETSIIVGLTRTFVQLSLLGAILRPIFSWGLRYWWVVVGYVFCLMATVAATEASARSKYYFVGLFELVLGVTWLTMAAMGLFAFGILLRPDPLWSPQYVIPLSGMLLGNCVNAVSLSINGALTNIKEGQREMEILQTFGATPVEASARLVREAVGVGAMPVLNGMAVIGLVSIPGMMTGQILAGNLPMKAAQYQMLVTILIANMTFALILGITGLIRYLAFDPVTQIIQTDRFKERLQRPSLWMRLKIGRSALARGIGWLSGIEPTNTDTKSDTNIIRSNSEERLPLSQSNNNNNSDNASSGCNSYYVAPTQNGIQLTVIQQVGRNDTCTVPEENGIGDKQIILEVTDLSKWLENDRILFDRINLTVRSSSIVLVSGPSGSGKSQLLRILAGLTHKSGNHGTIHLRERTLQEIFRTGKAHNWRRKVRYVGQQKMELLGTPHDFLRQIVELRSWCKSRQMALRRRKRLSRGLLRGSGGWSLLTRLAPSPVADDTGSGSQLSRESDSAATYRLAEEGMPEYEELLQSTNYLIQQWGLEESILHTKWKVLSGGEAQRVHLALAIASRPRILLLDEATSALDLDTKLRVENTIKQVAFTCGIGVVWITHDDEQMKRLIESI